MHRAAFRWARDDSKSDRQWNVHPPCGTRKRLGELREKPEIIRTAVEEILRYESPVQFTARVLKEDVEICWPDHSEEVVDPMHARRDESGSEKI